MPVKALDRSTPTALPTALPAVLAAAAVLLAACLGCTPAAGQGAGRPYRAPTAAEQDTLEHAESLLVGACMKDRGYRYTVVPPAQQPPVPPDFPYGIDDAEFARSHGFGTDLDLQVTRRAATDPNRSYARSLGSARGTGYAQALTGTAGKRITVTLPSGFRIATNTTGCLAQARRTLYGDHPAWFAATRTAENLKAVYQARTRKDPAYAAAVRKWSACMSGRGWQVKDLEALRMQASAASHRAPTRRQLAHERAAAGAEAECVRATGLVAVALRVEEPYRTRLEQTHAAAVRTRDRLAAAALPRARELVAEAGTGS
ncbi:hypothetical protein LG634_13485 [Streptomyces bambusae]|uniref:hypothetical protein n=1 Tax=Streptomyces bambusae TaxID=1550616 RepID=UPI001CFDF1C0|nr:hypothetical protein [Streptomyces bambusae]MCB5165843.1 hypothetical protein [Streptomyces bambusae]